MSNRAESGGSGVNLSKLQDLLDQNDVSALLGVSGRTLERWRAKRLGPPWVPLSSGSRTVRYSRAALDKWLANKTVSAA